MLVRHLFNAYETQLLAACSLLSGAHDERKFLPAQSLATSQAKLREVVMKFVKPMRRRHCLGNTMVAAEGDAETVEQSAPSRRNCRPPSVVQTAGLGNINMLGKSHGRFSLS